VNTYNLGAEADLQELISEDPQTALDLLLIRNMMEHRGIARRDLAREVGISNQWLSLALRGKAHRPNSPQYEALIYKLEAGITRITSSRGGIPKACCSSESYAGYRSILEFQGLGLND